MMDHTMNVRSLDAPGALAVHQIYRIRDRPASGRAGPRFFVNPLFVGDPQYVAPMENEQLYASKTPAPDTRNCPICGHESWPIAYGMMFEADQQAMPKTVFAGCCLEMSMRNNAVTGEPEMGIAEWECQNPDCRHQWW